MILPTFIIGQIPDLFNLLALVEPPSLELYVASYILPPSFIIGQVPNLFNLLALVKSPAFRARASVLNVLLSREKNNGRIPEAEREDFKLYARLPRGLGMMRHGCFTSTDVEQKESTARDDIERGAGRATDEMWTRRREVQGAGVNERWITMTL